MIKARQRTDSVYSYMKHSVNGVGHRTHTQKCSSADVIWMSGTRPFKRWECLAGGTLVAGVNMIE